MRQGGVCCLLSTVDGQLRTAGARKDAWSTRCGGRGLGDGAEVGHEDCEGLAGEGLRAVAEGAGGVGMDLDEEGVGSRCHGRSLRPCRSHHSNRAGASCSANVSPMPRQA